MILKEAGKGYATVAMGVSPRPGKQLFFGNTAARILREWANPLLLVAS